MSQPITPTTGEMPDAIDAMSIPLVLVAGRPYHALGGRLLPVLAGADDPPAPPADPPTPPTPPATGDDQGDADDDESKLPEKARALITKLRQEVKAGKGTAKELAETKARLKELEDAQLSEAERAKQAAETEKQRSAKLEADLRVAHLENAVERASSALKIVDPEAALRLMDQSAVEYGDDGKPTNVQALLSELVKAKPYLVDKSGNGNVPPTPQPANHDAASAAQKDQHRQQFGAQARRWI